MKRAKLSQHSYHPSGGLAKWKYTRYINGAIVDSQTSSIVSTIVLAGNPRPLRKNRIFQEVKL